MNISLTIAGILCVSILGTLLHFTYRWSGRNPLIGLIAPVNESVWEHMKLLFFPMLLFGLWNLKGVTDACRISAFHAGLLMGTLLIPVLFYAYTSVLGRNFLVLDIALFYNNILHLRHCGLSHIPRIVRELSIGKIQPCDIHGRVSFIDLFSAVYLFSAGIFYF